MVNPNDLVTRLLETFDKSAVELFREFCRNNRGIKKWVIASDYCLRDSTRPNDSFVFSIIPYDDWFCNLQAEIRSVLPRDIKKTKKVNKAAARFLANPRRFHFGFVLNKDRVVFTNGPGSSPLRVVRESIEMTYQHLVDHERSRENLRRFNQLRQESLAKSFNVTLMSDLHILGLLFPVISLLLLREGDVEIVGWFSDPDNMTTWCDGVAWDYATENLRGLCNQYRHCFAHRSSGHCSSWSQ